MLIKRLKLRNIRSYSDSVIEFPEGSTLLSGDIGAGKSSILLALEFALFGIIRPNLTGSALLRNGEEKGEVELLIDIDGKEVVIKRTLKKARGEIQQDSGYVIIDGIKHEGTAVELKSKVLDLIGYPRDLLTKSKDLIYRYTVYTPQEGMKQIIMEHKDTRLNTLRKVFGIDKYKQIRENTVTYIRSLKEKKNRLEGILLGLEIKQNSVKENKEELDSIRKRISDLDPKLNEMKKGILQEKDLLKQKEVKIEELKKLKHELELSEQKLAEKISLSSKYKTELKDAESQIRFFESKYSSISHDPSLPKDESSAEKQLSDQEKKLAQLTESYARINQDLALATTKHKDMKTWVSENIVKTKDLPVKESRLSILKEEVSKKLELRARLEDMQKQIDVLNASIQKSSALKDHSEELKKKISALDNCPTCLQPVTSDHKSRINDKENANICDHSSLINQHTEEKMQKTSELQNLKKELDALEEKEKELTGLDVEIRSLSDISKEVIQRSQLLERSSREVASLEKLKIDDSVIKDLRLKIQEIKLTLRNIRDNNSLLKEKANLKTLIDEKIKSKDKLNSMLEDIKKEIGMINAEKLQLNSKLGPVKGLEEEYTRSRESLAAKEEEERKQEILLAELRKEAEALERTTKMLETEITEKLQAKEKLSRLTELQDWLEKYFIALMSTIEKNVMLKIYHEFNNLFTEWFDIIVEDETLSVRLDEEFTPVITQNGYDLAVENLSGGERTACALAYRLSLNKVINDVMSRIKTKDLIILDEPTDGFSSEQLDKVRDVLDQIDIKQTIIVSHESKIESYVDNVVRVSKREHASSAE